MQVYPTVNSGTFNFKNLTGFSEQINLIIYDLWGQPLKQFTLNSSNNIISLQPCSAGVYIWKTQFGGITLQMGKMIVL